MKLTIQQKQLIKEYALNLIKEELYTASISFEKLPGGIVDISPVVLKTFDSAQKIN